MKVLWANYCDYSNLTYGFARSLQAVGIDSEAVCLLPHEYGYAEQATHVGTKQMEQKMNEADCIVLGHSQPLMLQMAANRGKRLFALHTGTLFRREPDKMNAMFNPFVERTFIDSPEFYNLGCKNVTYVAAAIDTDKIQYSPTNRKDSMKPVFAHYPSKGGFKGTEKIREMMKPYGDRFLCDESVVTHDENMKRIAACDVYIEMFAPTQEGNIYGSAGVTAWEASALGKFVITNSLYSDVYERTYGWSQLVVANTEEQFHQAVKAFDSYTMALYATRSYPRMWIEKKHSYQATGEYLKQFFVNK